MTMRMTFFHHVFDDIHPDYVVHPDYDVHDDPLELAIRHQHHQQQSPKHLYILFIQREFAYIV